MEIVKTKKRRQQSGKKAQSHIALSSKNDAQLVQFTNKTEKMILFKDLIPSRICTKMKYIVTAALNNAGLTSASRQMNANGIYDVDPAVASTSVAGFAELMNLYTRYRVFKNKSRVEICSREAFPILANLSIEPSFFTANTKTYAYFENSNNVTRLLAQGTANSRVVMQMERTAEEIVGDKTVYADLVYTGTSAANPSALWYTTVAIDSGVAGLVLVNGATIRWEIDFWVELFERRQFDQ